MKKLNWVRIRSKLIFVLFSTFFNLISAQPSMGFMFDDIKETQKGALSLSVNVPRNLLVSYTLLDNFQLGLGFSYTFYSVPLGPVFDIRYIRPVTKNHSLTAHACTMFDIYGKQSKYDRGDYNYYKLGLGYRLGNNNKNISIKVTYSSSINWWYPYLFEGFSFATTVSQPTEFDYNSRSREWSGSLSAAIPINKRKTWYLITDIHYSSFAFSDDDDFIAFLPSGGLRYNKRRFTLDFGFLNYDIRFRHLTKKLTMTSPVVRLEFLFLNPKQKLN